MILSVSAKSWLLSIIWTHNAIALEQFLSLPGYSQMKQRESGVNWFSTLKLKLGFSTRTILKVRNISQRSILKLFHNIYLYFDSVLHEQTSCQKHLKSVHPGHRLRQWAPCWENKPLTYNVPVNQMVDTCGLLCLSDDSATAFSRHKQLLQIDIRQHKLFHLNFSFHEFRFTPHKRCKVDFLYIRPTPGKYFTQSKHHVYCGLRHPWTMIHIYSTASVHILSHANSRLRVQHQIIDSTVFQDFDLCPFTKCKTSGYCSVYHNKVFLKLELPYFKYYTHYISFHLQKLKYLIFNLQTDKIYCLSLILNLHRLTSTLQVFDGPSVESKQLQNSHKTNRLVQLSSFQATIAMKPRTNEFNYPKQQTFRIHYCGKQQIVTTNRNSIELQPKYAQSLFQTYWIPKPGFLSHVKVSVDYVNYTGPMEPTGNSKFGGVSFWLFTQQEKTKHIFTVNHNFTVDSHDQQTNKYVVLGESDTKFVVVVYYFYERHSKVSGRVLVSNSSCVGKYLIIDRCKSHNINLTDISFPFEKQYSPEKKNVGTNKCIVVSLRADMTTVHFFKYVHMCDSRRIRYFRILVTYPKNNTLMEIQYEFNSLSFSFFWLTDSLLIETERNRKVSISFKRQSTRRYKKYPRLSDTLMKPESHINFVLVQQKKGAYQSFSTLSHLQRKTEAIHVFADDKYMEEDPQAWARFHWHLVTCDNFKIASLSDRQIFLDFLKRQHCQNMSFKQTNMSFEKMAQASRFALLPISDGAWQHAPLTKTSPTAVVDKWNQIEHPLKLGMDGVYVDINLTQSNISPALQFRMTDDFSPLHSFQFMISQLMPETCTSLYIPSPLASLCYYFNGLCNFNLQSTMPREITSTWLSIHHKSRNKKAQYHLRTLCDTESNTCSGTFLSWLGTKNLCTKKGMQLPEMFSTRDMNQIYEEVEYFNRLQKNKSQGFLYEPVSIYIGIDRKVSPTDPRTPAKVSNIHKKN